MEKLASMMSPTQNVMGLVGDILMIRWLEISVLYEDNLLSVCSELEVFNLVVASVNQF
jgi:hypothetical protein